MHVSQTEAELGLTLYVVAYGLSPLFFAPLSEIPSLEQMIFTLEPSSFFAIFQIPTILHNSYNTLMDMRFFTAFYGQHCPGNWIC